MKASELIEELQKLIDEHGDQVLLIHDPMYDINDRISTIQVTEALDDCMDDIISAIVISP